MQFQVTLKILKNNAVQFKRIILAVHNIDELETFIDDTRTYTSDLLDITALPIVASIN
jgi:hypothetical protein